MFKLIDKFVVLENHNVDNFGDYEFWCCVSDFGDYSVAISGAC